MLDPDIVLFDEPDSGLDPVRTALLCELIQEIHEENGGAYVVITHDIMSARRVAEHIAVLWKGRIVESGPAEELFNSDNAFVRQFLSGRVAGAAGHGVARRAAPRHRQDAATPTHPEPHAPSSHPVVPSRQPASTAAAARAAA